MLLNRVTIYEKNIFNLFALVNNYRDVFVDKEITANILKNKYISIYLKLDI